MSSELADYLSRRASKAFRGLAYYDRNELEIVYTRDDLGRAAIRERAETIRAAVQPRREHDALDELGTPRATVQMREHAVILHFPVGDDTGYLVGLEPDVARDLSTFVDDCLRILEKSDGRVG